MSRRQQLPVDPFVFSPDDPLAEEHAAIAQWVGDATTSVGGIWYGAPKLKGLPSGQKLLDAEPEQARRYVLAALVQARHWFQVEAKLRADGAQYFNPGGIRANQVMSVLDTFLKRKLPLNRDDLVAVLSYSCEVENVYHHILPVGPITRSLERHVPETNDDAEIQSLLRRFASTLRTSSDKNAKRLSTNVEQLCVGDEAESKADVASSVARLPAPGPSPAGNALVFAELKQTIGMSAGEDAPPSTIVEPDRFSLCDESPLWNMHASVGELLAEICDQPHYHNPDLESLASARPLLQAEPAQRIKFLLTAAERHVHGLITPLDANDLANWKTRYASAALASSLLSSKYDVTERDDFFDWLLYLSIRPSYDRAGQHERVLQLLDQVEQVAESSPLTEGERFVLSLFRAALVVSPLLGTVPVEVARVTSLIGDGASFFLVPGEVWADAVNAEIAQLKPSERRQWTALLGHALSASTARPSAKWLKTAGTLIDGLGPGKVRDALANWYPLVAKGQSIRRVSVFAGDARTQADTMHGENATCLRGLLWMTPLLPDRDELARTICAVT